MLRGLHAKLYDREAGKVCEQTAPGASARDRQIAYLGAYFAERRIPDAISHEDYG